MRLDRCGRMASPPRSQAVTDARAKGSIPMKLTKLLLSASFLCSLAGAANASLILFGGNPPLPVATIAQSFTDITAQGFGNAPRLLTLQTTGVETGSVTPVDMPQGDAVPGSNKSTTPTIG